MISIRSMLSTEADQVAAMFRQLPADLGQDALPRITGEALNANSDLIHVLVAVEGNVIVGAVSWVITFSTWRATRGMYCCDLYISAERRGQQIGERLLRAAAQDAAQLGAEFIKLEASLENPAPGKFYSRFGFHKADDDGVWFLEPDGFAEFVKGKAK